MEKFHFLKKENINSLPSECGVYCFVKKNEILYIGKSVNIKNRVKNHLQEGKYKNRLLLNETEKIGYIKTNSEIEALILEANLIKKYQPKFNVVWRDDKNFFFVGHTKENFPRIFWTHQKKVNFKNLKVEYVGPFVDGKALKQTLKILRKIFPYRSCYKMPKKPCLWYHLNYCLAPCLLKSNSLKGIPIEKLKIKNILQKNTKNVMEILKGKKTKVLKELKKEMNKLAKNLEFEEAKKIKEQIDFLEKTIRTRKVLEENSKIENWQKTEEKLKKILKIDSEIKRIEAYDISQLQGSFAVGSLVTFINGLPQKNFYRRFKIKTKNTISDVEMIKEILKRRINHPEWGFPDLILIDGGKPQLNAALQVKKNFFQIKKIPILAIAKRENKLYIENEKNVFLLKNLSREIFNLILKIRDEAHRFAISFHRKLRERNLFKKID